MFFWTHDQEALILQGCGGDLTEWGDGINGILTEEGILKNVFQFEEVYTFKNEDLTCHMFPRQDESKMNVGKLAMWRLATHEILAAPGSVTMWKTVLEGLPGTSLPSSIAASLTVPSSGRTVISQ